jgi:muramoyltetrapeptide carboxypeptidase
MEKELKIALVSPSSTFEPEKLQEALKKVKEYDLAIISSSAARQGRPGFLNGSVQERLEELIESDALLADALWCIRGGCGALDLWHDYKAEYYAHHKAMLIGYSDATILHFIRYYRAARIGIHGPMILEDEHHIENLLLLVKNNNNINYPPLKLINNIKINLIKSPLIIMNLLSLQSLIGLFRPQFFENSILALEEVHEPPYKIYRAMQQLKHAGILENIKALIIGHMSYEREDIINDIMKPLASDLAIPLFDWPIFGHEKPNWPLLFGAMVTISPLHNMHFKLSYA